MGQSNSSPAPAEPSQPSVSVEADSDLDSNQIRIANQSRVGQQQPSKPRTKMTPKRPPAAARKRATASGRKRSNGVAAAARKGTANGVRPAPIRVKRSNSNGVTASNRKRPVPSSSPASSLPTTVTTATPSRKRARTCTVATKKPNALMFRDILEEMREEADFDITVAMKYERFNSFNYGECTPSFVSDIIKALELKKEDVFVDIGAGIGNVCFQVAYEAGCTTRGVELRTELHAFGVKMTDLFQKSMTKHRCVDHIGDVTLIEADATQEEYADATVIFMNNVKFTAGLTQAILKRLSDQLKTGTRVVFVNDICHRFRKNDSWRSSSDPRHIFSYPPEKCFTSKGSDACSWKAGEVPFWIYTVENGQPQ
eukprot:TRINITY_DN17557_c0_g1_i1.p1 TRINITY_DN17557_c0_g1~~TRINITY_DN17557_c0_g1_i1.p1  ORF type:complete len:369 (+),score=82.21 TRINITY_DN17557_c0_g1_i1:42-1148(+)